MSLPILFLPCAYRQFYKFLELKQTYVMSKVTLYSAKKVKRLTHTIKAACLQYHKTDRYYIKW